ncbi:MAG TPA: protein kinase [Epsilonproteobacteria bacterium]|nr:protein kinase [Campylobacterota bacterium]
MQTLEQLKNGQLNGITRLKLSCGLKQFPEEILELAETLEVLDLQGNQLTALPDDFSRLKKLRILFLSNNLFTQIPAVISGCPELSMIGFKTNQIKEIAENLFPPKTRWLILTDNQIEKLPDSIGDLHLLQKCTLAGNRLTKLPDTMSTCTNLELLRISANQLEVIPKWLFKLPKLSWLAVAGNPCKQLHTQHPDTLEEISRDKITLHETLGEGASGVISKATIHGTESVAVKLFKGAVTSDGYPLDEMRAAIAAGEHDNLNTPFAKAVDHSEGKEGLLYALIPPHYSDLGNPPSLESCSRDTYPEDRTFTFEQTLKILTSVCRASLQLHQRGVNHGDLYAHNTLMNDEGDAILGDFGAASIYDQTTDNHAYERLEIRAFGCMMEELLERCSDKRVYAASYQQLEVLKNRCIQPEVNQRPVFTKINERLQQISLSLGTSHS